MKAVHIITTVDKTASRQDRQTILYKKNYILKGIQFKGIKSQNYMQVFATTGNLELTIYIARRNALPTQLEIILFFSSSKFTRGILLHMQRKSGNIKALLVFFCISGVVENPRIQLFIVHAYTSGELAIWSPPQKKTTKNLTLPTLIFSTMLKFLL